MINPETSLLALCIKYPDMLPVVRTSIAGKMFTSKKNAEVYNACLVLKDDNKLVDSVTLSEYIKSNKKANAMFDDESVLYNCLSEITATEVKASSYQDYTDIIVNNFRKQFAVNETRKSADKMKDGADVTTVVETLGENLRETERLTSKPFNSFLDIAQEEANQIELRAERGPVGLDELFVPMAFDSLGKFIKGFRYGSLSLLGARPAMGKTTFAVALAADAARRGIKTLFISIEMDRSEIAQKMLSHTSGIHFNKILEGFSLEQSDWDGLLGTMSKYHKGWDTNLAIDDESSTPSEVMRSINWAINEGYKYIIIDHLHELVFDDRRSHISLTEAMGDYVKRLRNMAQRNGLAVLALCQLNREVEKRSSKIPLPSDLGESGALERVAHNIIMLYRDEVYNRASEHKGELDVVVAKARGGQTGIATMDFDGGKNLVRDQIYELKAKGDDEQ
jgi:replicative DNA helicase